MIRHPEDFHIAKVSKATAKELKGSGYKVTKTGRAVIPLRSAESAGAKYDSAKISKGKIIFKSGGITEIVTPSTAKNFHSKLKVLATKPLKNNQMLTVKIGTNASFNSRFTSYGELYKYITETFNPKPGKDGKKVTGADLMRYMSIVEVTSPKVTKNDSPKSPRNSRDVRAKARKEKNTKQNLTRK